MSSMSPEEALERARFEITMATSANQFFVGSLAEAFEGEDWSQEVRVSVTLDYARVVPPAKLQMMWAVLAELMATELISLREPAGE